MTLTLLLDLDNTLISNHMDSFLPGYFKALGAHLHPYMEAERSLPVLLQATRKMMANQRPDQTLLEVFEQHFYPAFHQPANILQESIETFYREVFPSLRSLTQPRPEALLLVETALEKDWQLVVATNPLFPITAIEQRLEWAGLSPRTVPFALIPSVETFHFSKPNAAYYAELLGRLGWPEGAVVMVGDDPDLDIRPAQQAGLATFQVDVPGAPPNLNGASAHGSLLDLIAWLELTPQEQLMPDYTSATAVLSILRATPAVLANMITGQPDETLSAVVQNGEWSITEVLCHLRDVENEVNLPRIQKILQEENPFLPGMDTDPWAKERLYICQDARDALRDFTLCRMEVLALLERQAESVWQRSARHAIFGPTHLVELANIMAGHDRLHIQQTLRAIAQLNP